MNVKQLKAALETLPDDMKIILQKDAEGNGYSPLVGGEQAWYESESTWSGTAYSDEEDRDEYDQESCERVFLLWPVN